MTKEPFLIKKVFVGARQLTLAHFNESYFTFEAQESFFPKHFSLSNDRTTKKRVLNSAFLS